MIFENPPPRRPSQAPCEGPPILSRRWHDVRLSEFVIANQTYDTMSGWGSIMIIVIGLMIFRPEIDLIRKELNNIRRLEFLFRFVHPIWSFEDCVTVNPCNAVYIRRN